jgi:hypothetical protein
MTFPSLPPKFGQPTMHTTKLLPRYAASVLIKTAYPKFWHVEEEKEKKVIHHTYNLF